MAGDGAAADARLAADQQFVARTFVAVEPWFYTGDDLDGNDRCDHKVDH